MSNATVGIAAICLLALLLGSGCSIELPKSALPAFRLAPTSNDSSAGPTSSPQRQNLKLGSPAAGAEH